VIIRSLINRLAGPFRSVKVIFFDVGGTLVYSNLAHVDLLHQALVVVGYKVTREEVVRSNDHARQAVARRRRRHASGINVNEASRMWLDHLAENLDLDLQGADLERKLAAAMREVEARDPEVVDPDAVSLLSTLKGRGYLLGVISNWAADLPEYLAQRHLAGYFSAIIASEAVGTAKPHREIFLRGLAAMDVGPQHALHVGDDYWADVVGARDIGIRPVLLDRDKEAVHSDCPTITRLGDLANLL
jgi:HAD superfamily hydrolase (TIGR01549 family)